MASILKAAGLLDDYLTREQLAEEIDKSVRTIDRWYLERTGPAVTIIGNRRLYHIDDVKAWIRSLRQEMCRARATA